VLVIERTTIYIAVHDSRYSTKNYPS